MGTITERAPNAGPPRMLNIEAAWNIGVCSRLTVLWRIFRVIITW